MTLLNVFDTETTGFPQFKLPSNDPSQPHLVDIAALLYNADGELVDSFEAIIRPDGWTIPDEAANVHGITTEMAMDLGIPEAEALEGFLAIQDRAGMRVAHNCAFDDRILRIALMRYRSTEAADLFRAGSSFCTCSNSTKIVQLPPTERMIRAGRSRQFKQPNLAEAYRFFTGEELEGAHRAKADAEGCARVYFALKERIAVVA
ncbi:3'-5' exonuclease [Pseudomonas sp. B392_1p]|uniref:3'-5' exonuclease n=1 Tax=Pseudomonas sp. B392_1p TaxID=3457507 RepID=UPI003FCFA484